MNLSASLRSTMYAAGFILLCLLPRCTMSPTEGGGGHDGDAGAPSVLGLVVDKQGTALQSARVLLLPHDFNPIHDSVPPCDETITDGASARRGYCALTGDDGGFRFDTVAPGTYALNVADTLGRRVYVPGLTLSDSAADTVRLGAQTLRDAGVALIGRPDTSATAYVYIPGTDIGAHFDTLEPYVQLPLPSGSVDLYIGYRTGDSTDTVAALFTEREVLEGEIIDSSGVLDTLQVPAAPSGPNSAVWGDTACYVVRPVFTRKGLGADYRFRLGDGRQTPWTRDTSVCHRWDSTGLFAVMVQARSAVDTLVLSPWSDTLGVHVTPPLPIGDTLAPPTLIAPVDSVALDSSVSLLIVPGANTCGDSLEHRIDFGDGVMSPWNGATAVSHAWREAGIDTLRAQSRCMLDTSAVSAWSPIVELIVF